LRPWQKQHGFRSRRMGDNNKQYSAAIARCDTTAKDNGHTLDVWYDVSEELHASLCVICGAMVWVTRPGQEKRWRVGGAALEQECLEEDWRVEPGT
jgi:hypothetical protein